MKIFDEVAQRQNDMPSEYATLEANYADLAIKLNKDLDKAKDYLQKAKAYFQSTKVGAPDKPCGVLCRC